MLGTRNPPNCNTPFSLSSVKLCIASKSLLLPASYASNFSSFPVVLSINLLSSLNEYLISVSYVIEYLVILLTFSFEDGILLVFEELATSEYCIPSLKSSSSFFI